MGDRVYLDWNASAPLRDEAREAMIAAMDVVGNPSSVHFEGRATKALVERARDQVAAAVGCKPAEVIFTSGATEAASVLRNIDGRIEVEPTSHSALLAQARDSERAGAFAMGLANSETGVISEIPDRDELLLLDITQTLGRIPFAFSWVKTDMAICSAHKLGGPKGVGALIVREGLDVGPISLGGGQEMGRRSGTENVIGVAGFGAAIEAAMRDLTTGAGKKVAQLRNILESTLADRAKDTIFVGKDMERLPNTSYFATPGWKGETQVMAMDLAGYAISAGSACSSGKVRESGVLKAMGFDAEVARSGIRVSLGPTTTEDEVMGFADAWTMAYEKRRRKVA